jgi:hypothetical protein
MVFHFAEPGKIFITNTLMQRPRYSGNGDAEDKLDGEPQNNELSSLTPSTRYRQVHSSHARLATAAEALSVLRGLKSAESCNLRHKFNGFTCIDSML